MKKLLFVVQSIAPLLLAACAHQVEMPVTDIVAGQSFQVASVHLEGTREINVWTPADYAGGQQDYPVLYLIDGGQQQDFPHISGLAQLTAINASFEAIIVVGIKTENRFFELSSGAKDPRYVESAPRNGGSAQFRAHLTDEVIPFVELNYRTDGRRILVGESLAGLFIAETFLVSPNSFSHYICVSPSLWWDNKALAKQAVSLLKKHDAQERWLYLTMGNEGGTMQGGLDLLISALEREAPDSLDWHYDDRRDKDTHRSIYHGAVHRALLRFFGLPEPDYGPDPWYLIEGGMPESAGP